MIRMTLAVFNSVLSCLMEEEIMPNYYSRDEAENPWSHILSQNFIFDKYGIKSYGEIKQVDIPTVLQIVNKWEVSDRINNLFNLIG